MTQPRSLLAHHQQALIPGLLLFMAGALLASGGALPALFWGVWLGISLLSTLACLLFARQLSVLRWYVWLAAFFLGGLWFMGRHFEPGPLDVMHHADQPRAELNGMITARGMGPNQWVMAVSTVDQQKTQGHVLLKLRPEKADAVELHIGDTLNVTGSLMQPRTAPFPGAFDYQAYLRQHHLTALLYPQAITQTQGPPPTVWLRVLAFTDAMRDRIARHFQQHLPGPEGAIFASIVLGEHAVGLDTEIKTPFIRSGLIHILAASGLNVGIIGACILLTGKACRLPLRLRLLLAMASVAIYAMLTGLPPSVQRAGLMLELAFLLKFVNRELSAVTLLCITGVGLLFLNPEIITMLGFQLSFISTFGLLTMMPPLQERVGFYITQWGAGLLLVPMVAQAWVTPPLLYHFHQVQLLSLPANLLALPCVAVMTYIGFIAGGLSLVVPALSGWALSHLGFVGAWLYRIARFFGEQSFAVWQVPSPPLPGIVLMLGVLLLAAYALNVPGKISRRAWQGVLSISLLVLLAPMSLAKWQSERQTEIVWLSNNGQSGVELIRLPHNTVFANVTSLPPYLARDVVTYCRQHGISHIQVLNLATPAMATLAGLPVLMESLPVAHVTMASGAMKPRRLQEVEASGVSVVMLSPTHEFKTRTGERAVFLSAPPTETLQRFEMSDTCFALRWGQTSLTDSALKPATQDCVTVLDQQPGRSAFLWLDDQPPRALTLFSRLLITPKNKA